MCAAIILSAQLRNFTEILVLVIVGVDMKLEEGLPILKSAKKNSKRRDFGNNYCIIMVS
jgi:hypothetical protein